MQIAIEALHVCFLVKEIVTYVYVCICNVIIDYMLV